MADLNSTIVRGNLRVTDDINTSGTIAGNGSGLTNLNASNIGSGSLAVARIAPGTNGQFLSTVSGVPTWVNNPDTDNDKKTASTNSNAKLFLIGATSQSSSGQDTYSNSSIFIQSGDLFIDSISLKTHVHSFTLTTNDSNNSSNNRIKYIEAVSFSGGILTLQTKYLDAVAVKTGGPSNPS